MQKPQESLDDFFNRIEPPATTPPSPVKLRPTGEVETLKPLARWEWPSIPAPTTEEIPVQSVGAQPAPLQLSWFHRSLIFGGGVAVIALVFLSAIFTAVSERPEQAAAERDASGISSDEPIDESLVPVEEEPETADMFTSASSPLMFGELRSPRTGARPRRIRSRVEHAAYRPRRRLPAPKSVVSDFVPTTLIIYPENGEIKTRIEPNLTAAFKRPATFPN